MQAYEVEFVPAQLTPVRIKDAIAVSLLPHPHVSVGDPDTPGRGVRVPLTSRLTASCDSGAPFISQAAAYRDPKTGRIVLGIDQATDASDRRALVLLAASSRFPDGVSVTLPKGTGLLAKGAVRNGEQILLIWPEGGSVVVDDPARQERYELRRTGDQFAQVALPSAG